MGGCCAGAQKAGPSRTSGTDDGSLLEKGQLPVARNWTSKTPITISELKLKRETFWDTQPHYGGRYVPPIHRVFFMQTTKWNYDSTPLDTSVMYQRSTVRTF